MADAGRKQERAAENDRWILMYNSTADAQPVAEGGPETYTVPVNELFDSFMHIVQAND